MVLTVGLASCMAKYLSTTTYLLIELFAGQGNYFLKLRPSQHFSRAMGRLTTDHCLVFCVPARS